ncbi:MAG: hypothetical protein QOH32_2869, partial [Bradyrhizobium sp.]|nr:hypothetical protein [Bradyrhizobium sp.]
ALFAPPALGLLLALAGLVIGNQIRTRAAGGIEAEAESGARPLTGTTTQVYG